tara:strand:- start:25 stop:453 length:429 start_codon:yes stop_codon:yes gene_type:complete
MKICSECKDVVMYCKCLEEYVDSKTKLSDKEIFNNLKVYISGLTHTHPKEKKWKELFDLIVTTKSIDDCNSQSNLEKRSMQLNYMKNNPLKREFGITPSVTVGVQNRMKILDRHIEYAFNLGKIKEVDKFIRSLNKCKDWCC